MTPLSEPPPEKKPQENTNLLTVEEFAAYWRISRRSVFSLIKRGLPSVLAVGLGRRVLAAESDRWLRGGGGKPLKLKANSREKKINCAQLGLPLHPEETGATDGG